MDRLPSGSLVRDTGERDEAVVALRRLAAPGLTAELAGLARDEREQQEREASSCALLPSSPEGRLWL